MTSQEYAADNKSAKDKTLIIEHPIRAGWKLVDTQKPIETTPTLYRFKGIASANKVTTLRREGRVSQLETIAHAVDATSDHAALLQPQRRDSARRSATRSRRRSQLKQAVARRSSATIDVAASRSTRSRAEQNRIRENMKTVAQGTQYYERLLSKLNEQESSIETLQRERAAIIVRRDAARKDLDDYLTNLTIE